MEPDRLEEALRGRGFRRRGESPWAMWLSDDLERDADAPVGELIEAAGALAEAGGERGQRHRRIRSPEGDFWHLKQFHRGGVLAGENDVEYPGPERFFAAALGGVRAREAGVCTPEVLGVIVRRGDAGCEGFLLAAWRDLRPFSAAARGGWREGFHRAGELLARLHGAGLDHGDYQLKNLHLDGEDRLNVVDFDPVAFAEPSGWTREWRLHRFARSLFKYGFSAADRRAFVAGYESVSSRWRWMGRLQAPAAALKNRLSDLRYRIGGRPFESIETEKMLVRAPNWVGDAVMSLALIQRLHERFEPVSLDVVCRQGVADVYEHHPDVGTVHRLPDDKRWSLPGSTAGARYATLLVIPKSFRTGLQAGRSGIPRRIGFAAQGRSLFFTDPVPLRDEDRRVHHARLYERLTAPMGQAPLEVPLATPRLALPGSLRERARDRVGSGPFVALHPGSAYGPAKRWPPRHFRRLTAGLLEEHDLDVAVLGVEEERSLGEEILGGFPPDRVHNLAGETDLAGAMAVLAEAAACVANDSGLMHLAAALGTPTVGLFGSSDPDLTAPLGKHTTVLYEGVSCSPCFRRSCPLSEDRYRCLTRISPAAVLEELTVRVENAPAEGSGRS